MSPTVKLINEFSKLVGMALLSSNICAMYTVLCSLNQLKPVWTHCLRCYEFGGRILGRNWDKSIKSCPSCYSQSPLLKHFTPLPPWVKVGWNWFIMYSKHCKQKPLVREFSRLCPVNLNKIVRSWIQHGCNPFTHPTKTELYPGAWILGCRARIFYKSKRSFTV